MKKVVLSVCFLWVMTLAYSQQLHTTIDVLRASEWLLPKDIQRVLIVNNTVPQPEGYGHIIRSAASQETYQSTLSVDSAVIFYMAAMAQQLQRTECFEEVGLLLSSQNKSEYFFSLAPLTNSVVDSLCTMYDAQALIVVDKLQATDILDITVDYYNAYADLQVTTGATLSVRYPGESAYSYLYVHDTLTWSETSPSTIQAVDEVINRSMAIRETVTELGENTAYRFTPYWETVDRYLYDNGDEAITAGMQSFVHRHFLAAADAWQASLPGTKKKTYAMLCADIAVALEMAGDVDSALTWALKASDAFGALKGSDAKQQAINLRAYYEQLLIRQNDALLLSK